MERKIVSIYTDGSCLNNGAPDAKGGWAAILTYGNKRKTLTGSAIGTKNNRMELTAVIKGVEALKAPCSVTIITDSTYVSYCIENGRQWYLNGWKNASGRKPANVDLVQQLMEVGKAGNHKITCQVVKGHSGHAFNEKADKLAREAAQNA